MIDQSVLHNIRVFLERVPTHNMEEARQLFRAAADVEREIGPTETPSGESEGKKKSPSR